MVLLFFFHAASRRSRAGCFRVVQLPRALRKRNGNDQLFISQHRVGGVGVCWYFTDVKGADAPETLETSALPFGRSNHWVNCDGTSPTSDILRPVKREAANSAGFSGRELVSGDELLVRVHKTRRSRQRSLRGTRAIPSLRVNYPAKNRGAVDAETEKNRLIGFSSLEEFRSDVHTGSCTVSIAHFFHSLRLPSFPSLVPPFAFGRASLSLSFCDSGARASQRRRSKKKVQMSRVWRGDHGHGPAETRQHARPTETHRDPSHRRTQREREGAAKKYW